MIAVIADDFSGAAELAGIGLRYDLNIQLAMPGAGFAGADLLIISTDSRSLQREAAMRITGEVLQEIVKLKPAFIYKKIDSVLRGYVLDELNVQMEILGLKKAFVLPANPSLGRTIKDGEYYVGDKKIHETGFATDPEFSITNSSVLKMIRSAGEEMVLKRAGSLPAEGIVVGEAETDDEIKEWADIIKEDWVLAGAGDFFTALLNRQFTSRSQPRPVLASPHLYVSGTTFNKSREWIREVNERSGCVIYLKASIMHDNESWIGTVTDLLRIQGRCIIAFDEKINNIPAADLREKMAKLVATIIGKEQVKELFIEGGSTAASVLNELNIVSLSPVNELQRGVVRMQSKEFFITVKPGSYELPPPVIAMYS